MSASVLLDSPWWSSRLSSRPLQTSQTAQRSSELNSERIAADPDPNFSSVTGLYLRSAGCLALNTSCWLPLHAVRLLSPHTVLILLHNTARTISHKLPDEAIFIGFLADVDKANDLRYSISLRRRI